MATLIHCFSYHNDHNKLVSENEYSASYASPSGCRIVMPPSMRAVSDQSDQDDSDDSTQHQKSVKRRVRSSSPRRSTDKRGEIRGKRRGNRDSIFSFLSIISKNDDARSVERKDEVKKEKPSENCAQYFPSSSPTLNCTIKKPCQESDYSPCAGPCVPGASPRGQVTSTGNLSDNQPDLPRRKYSRTNGTQDKTCSNRNDETSACDLMTDSSRRHINFFQEQQEQEYRIAKAWLEAEECRKANLCVHHGTAIGSGSTELKNTWANSRGNRNDNRPTRSASEKGGSRDVASSRLSRPKSEAAAAHFHPKIDHAHNPKSKPLAERKEKSTSKQKRAPGLAGLANGMKEWLYRRANSK